MFDLSSPRDIEIARIDALIGTRETSQRYHRPQASGPVPPNAGLRFKHLFRRGMSASALRCFGPLSTRLEGFAINGNSEDAERSFGACRRFVKWALGNFDLGPPICTGSNRGLQGAVASAPRLNINNLF